MEAHIARSTSTGADNGTSPEGLMINSAKLMDERLMP